MIASRIPILSEKESPALEPDHYLALPPHFLDEFVERVSAFPERRGWFTVPLPEVRIVPE